MDRLVHRGTIFELNAESYRRRTAVQARRKSSRPASRATPANTETSIGDRQGAQE